MKPRLIVSACLLGVPCRYDGKAKRYAGVSELSEHFELIPICPECDGGLPTPRTPSEVKGDKVIMKDGCDVTEFFRVGAEKAVAKALETGAVAACLKARSPSCGKGKIYDGSFTKTLKNADGVTAKALLGIIPVYTEEETEQLCADILVKK